MPYFIYKITQSPGAIIKNLELIENFPSFRLAKKQLRILRDDRDPEEKSEFKVIFAENELEAEELLQVKREAPIVMEWEK